MLLPEPACNAMQEFVCASELIELGYPVSSPSVVEPAGDLCISQAVIPRVRSASELCISQAVIPCVRSASELADLGFPVSSPSVVEPAGDLAPVTATTPFT